MSDISFNFNFKPVSTVQAAILTGYTVPATNYAHFTASFSDISTGLPDLLINGTIVATGSDTAPAYLNGWVEPGAAFTWNSGTSEVGGLHVALFLA